MKNYDDYQHRFFFLLGFLVFEKLVVTRIVYIKKKDQILCYSFVDFLEIYWIFYQDAQMYQFLGFFTYFLLVFEPFWRKISVFVLLVFRFSWNLSVFLSLGRPKVSVWLFRLFYSFLLVFKSVWKILSVFTLSWPSSY